ncbi:MAG: host attachment protein [Myxococcota bacterium]
MRSCFIVADGKRARIFQVAPSEDTPPNLIEAETLTQPLHGGRGDERYTGARSDASMQGGGGRHYSLDDHRSRHDADADEKFARAVVERVRDLARDQALNRVVWIAEARMLGRLRSHFDLLGKGLKAVEEIQRDLSHLDVNQLKKELGEAVY